MPTLTITVPCGVAPLTDVYITLCSDASADGGGGLQITAYADGGATNVDTGVTVSFTVTGTGAGNYSSNIIISSGSACQASYFNSIFSSGEGVSTLTIDSITPSSSGTQQYNASTTSIGGCSVC